MPPQSDHLQQARHNSGLLATLNVTSPPYPDWGIVVAFYAALHLVEAYFAGRQLHLREHPRRNAEVDKDPVLHKAGVDWRYKRLYMLSRKARYDCPSLGPADLQDSLTKHYDPLLSSLRGLLGISSWP